MGAWLLKNLEGLFAENVWIWCLLSVRHRGRSESHVNKPGQKVRLGYYIYKENDHSSRCNHQNLSRSTEEYSGYIQQAESENGLFSCWRSSRLRVGGNLKNGEAERPSWPERSICLFLHLEEVCSGSSRAWLNRCPKRRWIGARKLQNRLERYLVGRTIRGQKQIK